MKRTFDISDLDCAACSVKIESAIREFKEISSCTLDFINKKLYIETAQDWQTDEELIEFLEKIVHIFEKDVHLTVAGKKEESEKNNKFNYFKSNYFEFTKIGLALVLCVLGMLLKLPLWASLLLYVPAYLLVGYDVIIKTIKKVTSKNFFDENLLMTIASIGAMIIGEYFEGVMVLLLYKLGEIFQGYAVEKSRKNIKDMLMQKVQIANLLRDGEEHQVNPKKLEIGDTIIVKKGERVPVDGIVVAGNGFLDTSMLTGESKPQKVSEGTKLLSGCINLGNNLVVRVTDRFEDSAVAQIMELVERASANKPKSEKFITKFARIYTPTVMLCALVVAFIPPIFVGNWIDWIYRALTFLVVSCPCAIVISVPLTFFSGLGVCAKRGLLIKGANVIENIVGVKTVVFDKTGTLTTGTFEVTEIKPSEVEKDVFVKFLCYAESGSNHPIAKSILKLYKGKIFASKISEYEDISGKGIKAHIENKDVLVGSAEWLKENGIDVPELNEGGSVVHMALNSVYAGYVVIADTIKPNAVNALQALKKLGVTRFVMLSGDKQDTAQHVAGKLGIDEVYAELMPEDKLTKLNEVISTTNGKVMYVGDGINDAPVLMGSDVGVSMGKRGSDIAIEAGDLVIMKDDLLSLVNSFKISKRTIVIALENIVFALTTKVIILVLGVLGISSLWLAVFADVGVSFIAILNAMRMLFTNRK